LPQRFGAVLLNIIHTSSTNDQALQQPQMTHGLNWTDSYIEHGDLQIIHLHGTVATKSPSPIVFSFSEYHKSAERHPVWNSVLAGAIATEPFLVIGARVLDDPDIEATLQRRHTPSSAGQAAAQ
ncbi:SIR2 family protein, partial [Pilimelia columellifera]|uniref:SIR2 family protein n=1 Tax=Pilimelia columellifera TaxID=706574 RepID=UPI0031E02B4E